MKIDIKEMKFTAGVKNPPLGIYINEPINTMIDMIPVIMFIILLLIDI